MSADKMKQYIALFGGLLSAILLLLQALGIELSWFNDATIDAFVNVLMAAVPFILVLYGVWKNTYVVTKRAREQEAELKKKGLK